MDSSPYALVITSFLASILILWILYLLAGIVRSITH